MIRLAKKIARTSECRNKHGAVVTSGRRVLGVGANTYRTHATYGGGPLQTLHAEAAAIRDAKRKGIDLRGKDLYVARIDAHSKMSKPCPSCARLIEAEGIRKVYYTDENGCVVDEYPPPSPMEEEYENDILAPGEGYIQLATSSEGFEDDEMTGVDPYSGHYFI